MISRAIIILTIILLGNRMGMSETHAEDVDDKSSSNIIGVNENDTEVSSDNNELSFGENSSTNANSPILKKRSVKMIVGGQSENGLAKQVRMPVNN
jgi:hypothetical protein